jgi:multisubunit Na+/H+ antiporter MnhG subunit
MSGAIATAVVFGLVLVFGAVLAVERFKDMKKRLAEKEAPTTTNLAG